jgi:hypothetical protein
MCLLYRDIIINKKKVKRMQNNQTFDSAVSYAIGGGSAIAATLVDISTIAQSLAIIIGCFVVFVRLIHDSFRLYAYLKELFYADNK